MPRREEGAPKHVMRGVLTQAPSRATPVDCQPRKPDGQRVGGALYRVTVRLCKSLPGTTVNLARTAPPPLCRRPLAVNTPKRQRRRSKTTSGATSCLLAGISQRSTVLALLISPILPALSDFRPRPARRPGFHVKLSVGESRQASYMTTTRHARHQWPADVERSHARPVRPYAKAIARQTVAP